MKNVLHVAGVVLYWALIAVCVLFLIVFVFDVLNLGA